MRRRRIIGLFGLLVGLTWTLGPASAISHEGEPEHIASLNPFTRGVEVAPNGVVTVAENQLEIIGGEPVPVSSELLQFRIRRGEWEESTIGVYGEAVVDIANKAAGKGSLFVMPGGPELGGSGDVVKWSPDDPLLLTNMIDWRTEHPDPDDLEGHPEDTNQWAIAPVGDGTILLADAGGNEVVRIGTDGTIESVARFLPIAGIAGPPLPPGALVEAVPTSVAVGPDGAWYVGQLVGFAGIPAPTGTASVWRIEPGTTGAICDPAAPDAGPCTVFETGFTSIMDVDFGGDGALYVLEFARGTWLAAEMPGAPFEDLLGNLWKVDPDGTTHELSDDALLLPSGLAVGENGSAYVINNFFGIPVPGYETALLRISG